MSKAKKVFKVIGIVLLIIVLIVAGLLIFLTATEYRPEDELALRVAGQGEKPLSAGGDVALMSWNIGYGALGAGQDFFMDGGEMVRPGSADIVQGNMDGIISTIAEHPCDVYLLQEVDADSKRSYNINEAGQIWNLTGGSSSFAYNYHCDYVPYPLPTIGRVRSGIFTVTDYNVAEATRIALPSPFSWPVSTANLKRCLMVSRVPLMTGEELVLVNLHLEAYDDGAGKAAQTEMLMGILTTEYEKGNYVIAGGDFNQTFPGVDMEKYPLIDTEHFIPGVLEELPDGWQYAFDGDVPSSRLLSGPFSGDYATTQLYIIDGYILSPNVKLNNVETLDLGFTNSDHHPVLLEVTLNPAA